MERFGEILGQEQARELLASFLDSDRIPQALVFQGPAGVGKATLASAFTAVLLCESAGPGSCGKCAACRLLEKFSHPDCLLITLQPKNDSPAAKAKKDGNKTGTKLAKDITVNQIREVIQLSANAPRLGRKRIFIIDPAERMNRSAQNALLKTLEEPSPNTILILITSRPHLLASTVRSRCISVQLGALRTKELSGMLEQKGFSAEEALKRSALSGGCPGAALALEPEALEERREEVLGILESLAGSPVAAKDLPLMAADLAGKDEASLVNALDLMQGLLRDALRAGLEGADAAMIHADLANRLETLRERLGIEKTAALVHHIERLRGELRFNLNRVLIAETLLAELCGGQVSF